MNAVLVPDREVAASRKLRSLSELRQADEPPKPMGVGEFGVSNRRSPISGGTMVACQEDQWRWDEPTSKMLLTRREQNVLIYDGLLKIALADAEARAGDPDRAIAIIDEALATCNRTGYRAFEAELHRVRGEMLLKRNSANPAPAEEAFLTAIAVAKQQTARSFGLRAAVSLAKLYRATGRDVDAQAVLAPALEGFPARSLLPSGRRAGDEGPPGPGDGAEALTPDPSPERERGDAPFAEMPEIAEAQALLAALSQTDEFKAQAAHRHRLTHLQVAYGNALIAARGFGAPETTEAFARARESAHGDDAAPERLAADYGLWASSYVRGELASMRTHAAAFLADVSARPNSPEASVAHRVLGSTHLFTAEYEEARDHLELALALFQPVRDDDLAFRFGQDAGVAAMLFLAFVLWQLGEVERAVSLVGGAQERIASVTHVGTHAYGKMLVAMFELMRRNPARAAANAVELARVAREHDLPIWRAHGAFLEGLATAERGALGEGLSDMRRGVELLREQNFLGFVGLMKIAVAEAEARAGNPDRAIAILDEALATVDRLGYCTFEAELHRARGEILLKLDPSKSYARRGSLSDLRCRRAPAGSPKLRPARGAVARETLSIDRPPRRGPRRSRSRPRRLFADAGNAGDRRGAGAAGGASRHR